jgi:glycosyltransferase involved in cell wall biosynthesis
MYPATSHLQPNQHPSDVIAGRAGRGVMPKSKIPLMIVTGTLTGGGAERFVSNFLCHLDRRRYDPTLLLLRNEIGFPIPAEIPRIVVDHRGWQSTLGTIRRIRNAIEQVKPAVILTNMDSNGKFVGAALRTTSIQPVWIARTSNDPAQKYRGVRGHLNKLWLRRVYPRADYFVANSEGLADRFRTFFPFASDRTRTIGNPVDLEQLEEMASQVPEVPIESDVPNIVFLGRLERQKRPDILIEAFRQIVDHRRAKLLICGDGPLRGEVKRLIARYDLTNSVRLLGFCENPFPILKTATIVISTSDFEGLPNVLLEAQALGIPAVATNCGFGPSEIIEHGVTGLLTETGQPQAIADAAEQILCNPERLREMSIAATEKIRRKYNAVSILAQWMDLFEEAINNSGSLNCFPLQDAVVGQPPQDGNTRCAA